MNTNEFSELTNDELLQEQKKEKTRNIINATIIGLFLGVAIYSFVMKGLGFPTFFSLFFAFILFNKKNKNKALEEELKSRNLK